MVYRKCGMDADAVSLLEQRLTALNQEITDDRSLGPQYQIGHSYVTPLEAVPVADCGIRFNADTDSSARRTAFR